jgi:hypothetical protein
MTMEQLLYKKPCITLTVYENAMGFMATKTLKEMVMNAGGYTVATLTIKNAFNKNPLPDANKKRIEKTGEKLVKKIKKNRYPLFSKLYAKIAVNIFMKPYALKDAENNKGLIDSWQEKKLI